MHYATDSLGICRKGDFRLGLIQASPGCALPVQANTVEQREAQPRHLATLESGRELRW
jgi:hypothetical protein